MSSLHCFLPGHCTPPPPRQANYFGKNPPVLTLAFLLLPPEPPHPGNIRACLVSSSVRELTPAPPWRLLALCTYHIPPGSVLGRAEHPLRPHTGRLLRPLPRPPALALSLSLTACGGSTLEASQGMSHAPPHTTSSPPLDLCKAPPRLWSRGPRHRSWSPVLGVARLLGLCRQQPRTDRL